MSEPIFAHHRSDGPLWRVLIDAANLEHEGDWPVVQVTLAMSAELVDHQESITEEVIYADNVLGDWRLDYSVSFPYNTDDWTVSAKLYEPANIIPPAMLKGLFGEELEAGRTVRFHATIVDSYDCDDCRELPPNEALAQNCDHTLGWALVWAIHY